MNKDTVLATLKHELPHLQARFGVARIGLFGSYAQNTQQYESDVDLLLEFSRPPGFAYFDLLDHLESVLGARVDVVTLEGLRSIRIEEVAAAIRDSVIYV